MQRLCDHGLVVNDSNANLLLYKALFDDQIELAGKERDISPFGIAHKVFNTHINRWTKISRALEVVANPHSAYGSRVNYRPSESDDRKRQTGPESLASSSPSVTNEEDDNGTPQPQ